MKFKEPLHVVCPECREHFDVKLAWLMQEGQYCPKCSASFATIQQPIRESIRDVTRLVNEVQFIMALEGKFGITLNDEDVRGISTADGLLRYISDALNRGAGHCDDERIWTEIRTAAAEELGIASLSRGTELFDWLRR